METPILDEIVRACQVHMASYIGPVNTSVLINTKTWREMDKEISRTPIIGCYSEKPLPWEPWKISIYSDCVVTIYSSDQIPKDIIQVFVPVSTTKIQNSNGEEKNTLPGS